MNASLVFYYDVVCPYAYMASRLVQGLAKRTGAALTWKPVLLVGLYEATGAPQGKEGSALDAMSLARIRSTKEDLLRLMYRHGVPHREPTHFPQRTVNAMKLLAGIEEQQKRIAATHALYQAFWYHGRNLEEVSVLEEVVAPLGLSATELIATESAAHTLRANTAEAAQRGAFGVPSFYCAGRMFWGTDRMFLVERALGLQGAAPERLAAPPPDRGMAAKLTIFFDYLSPWSYLAAHQLEPLLRAVRPVAVSVEWVPITAPPMQQLTTTKQAYQEQELRDWTSYAGLERSLKQQQQQPPGSAATSLPFRVTLAADCDPAVIKAIHEAAWLYDKDVSDENVVRLVLEPVCGAAVSERLVREASSAAMHSRLLANIQRAEDEGVCGVPSFRVNGGPVIWGQDKLNVVADMLCGWEDHLAPSAKL